MEVDGVRVEVIPDGIIRITYPPGARVEATGARRIIEACHKLASGSKCPLLVDAREIRRADRDAREIVSGAEGAAVTSCVAILIDGALSSVIGNFFLRVSRPIYPTRLFTDGDEARRWLLATSAASR